MIKYDKLVRDRIIEIILADGREPRFRIAKDDKEYKNYLIKKLREEIEEFLADPSPEELADIKEVTAALEHLNEFRHVNTLQSEKRQKRGGFEKRLVLEEVESPPEN